MRKRNTIYDIGDSYHIDYKKIHTEVVVADIYEASTKGVYKYNIIGSLFSYFYEFDEEELDPIADNSWNIYIQVYQKKHLTQELFDLILHECRNNTFARAPFYAQMELSKIKPDLLKTEGRISRD